jgi:hypothetical protein
MVLVPPLPTSLDYGGISLEASAPSTAFPRLDSWLDSIDSFVGTTVSIRVQHGKRGHVHWGAVIG